MWQTANKEKKSSKSLKKFSFVKVNGNDSAVCLIEGLCLVSFIAFAVHLALSFATKKKKKTEVGNVIFRKNIKGVGMTEKLVVTKSFKKWNHITILCLCVYSGELHPWEGGGTTRGERHSVLCVQRPQHQCQHSHVDPQPPAAASSQPVPPSQPVGKNKKVSYQGLVCFWEHFQKAE